MTSRRVGALFGIAVYFVVSAVFLLFQSDHDAAIAAALGAVLGGVAYLVDRISAQP